LSYAQAVVGEMLGWLSIFALEEGRLTPMEKVRTPRHMLETFQEFVGEFSNPHHVAFVRGVGRDIPHSRPLREFIAGNFPRTSFSEHSLGRHLSALLGPHSLGLVIMEKNGRNL
jgi:fatty acid-binding protein DegV